MPAELELPAGSKSINRVGRVERLIQEARESAMEYSAIAPDRLAYHVGILEGHLRSLALMLERYDLADDEIPVHYGGEVWGVALRESEDDFDRRPELVGISLRGAEVSEFLKPSVVDRLYELAMESGGVCV